jgi:tetratricopeptide (TPR) repeat protein
MRASLPLVLLLALPLGLACAAFDADPPAREAAMGGGGVAGASPADGLDLNPALLANAGAPQAAARYQSLFSGLGDDLASGHLAYVQPLDHPAWGALGLSWDHFGADHLQEDRLRLGWGFDMMAQGLLSCGAQADWLRRAYDPGAALAAYNRNWSAQAFDMGLGLSSQLGAYLSLGASVEGLLRPNLGVLGEDRLERTFRLGAQAWLPTGLGPCVFQLQQEQEGDMGRLCGGVEWRHPLGLALRLGLDSSQLGAGLGYQRGALGLDYACRLGYQGPGSDLPASHDVEISWRFGMGQDRQPWDLGRRVGELLAMGREALARRDWQAAEDAARAAQALDAGSQPALALLGSARQARRASQAQELAGLGQRSLDLKDLGSARVLFDQALALDPSCAPAQQGLRQARVLLPETVLADPAVVKLLEAAGQARALSRDAEALGLLDQALALHPQDSLLVQMREAWQPAPLPQASPTPEPGNPQVERLLIEAESLRQHGRSDLARDAVRKALDLQPANPQARAMREGLNQDTEAGAQRSQDLYQQGLKAYAEGRRAEALRLWERALAADPTNLKALNSLTRARIEEQGQE